MTHENPRRPERDDARSVFDSTAGRNRSAPDGSRQCDNRQSGASPAEYTCTRTVGHRGVHEAHVNHTDPPVYVWGEPHPDDYVWWADDEVVFDQTACAPGVVYLVTIDSDGAYYTVLHDASQLADFLADGTISLSSLRRVDRWEWDGDEWIRP